VGKQAFEALTWKTLTARQDTKKGKRKKRKKKKKKVICCTHSEIKSHEFYAEKGLKML